MICPLCKNEKWEDDICPKCGLDENEALLTKTKELKLTERYLEAEDLFKKFILLEPGEENVLRMLATCLSIETISRRDVMLFERTRTALTQALDNDWAWDQGHQFQINLFICFGKQKDLIKDYEQIGLRDETRKNISEKMIKIIKLTEKYKVNPPMVSTNLNSDSGLITSLEKYWNFLFGLCVFLWAINEVPNISKGLEEKKSFLAAFIFFIFGTGILVLILVGMNIYRNNNGKKFD